jgi:DNA-binding HxlR family transcriptional regulator
MSLVSEPHKKALPRDQVSQQKLETESWPANPYASNCPTRLLLDRIADKWTVLLLILLERRPWRFNELRREVQGLTQKMASQTLKGPERDGLVSREVRPTVPVTVVYAITPLGRTLFATVDALRLWAETHMPDVTAAQEHYDATHPL